MNEAEWENSRRDPEKLLVLLAGQSNMAGRGYAGPDDLTPIPNVLMIRPDGKWQPAIEPITKDRAFIGTFQASGEKIVSSDPFETVLPQGDQKVVGVGLGRTFGRLLAEVNPGRTVGLIPCAVGGTSIAAWIPGGVDDHDPNNYPYDTAVKKAREAQKSGRIVAVLWHQGETDAKKQTPEYTEKLRTVIRNFRRDLQLGPEVPFIAGDMASFYPERIAPHIGIVDRALDELAAEDPSFRYVHTKDLTHRGDNLHFDTDSLHELGRRYFETYRQFEADSETCGLRAGLAKFTVSGHENTVFRSSILNSEIVKMKNLLLLGDSIRMGYDSFVQEKLAGRMNVYFAEDNGRFAQYTLRMVSEWKGKLSLPEIDVVHWNNGLWDVLHMDAHFSGCDGEAAGETIKPANVPQKYVYDKEPITPPEFYRYMIGRILTRIRQLFPKAEVIFATTTPVIEEQSSWAYRSNAEIDAYNQIAREVLIPRGVRINELGEFAKRECSDLHRDWTHFNDEGSGKLADEIIQFLEKENLI